VAASVSVLLPQGRGQGLAELHRFRNDFYDCLTARQDALFELGDALLVADQVPSLPYLSLDPVHRRGHGSVYAALSHGRIDSDAVRDLLADALPRSTPPVFAVDCSTWPRCDAECSPERGLFYHPSRHSAGQPIVAGWSYQLICALEFTRDSWTTPLDARRLTPDDNVNLVATAQIKDLLPRLDVPDGVPAFVFDAGYDPTRLQVELADAGVQILVRIRSDRCFYTAAPPRAAGTGGRPRRHGAKMALPDPTTWPAPTAIHTRDDNQYGHIDVTAWSGLHPKQRTYRDPDGQLTIVTGTVIRVQVSTLPGRSRQPTTLWLWWAGPANTPPDLDLCWRAYTRRFDLEHTVRFCKQTLRWTLPRPRTPQQADRWTWLIIAAYTQLRRLRYHVADLQLPWEKPCAPHQLTPGRVRRRFRAAHAAVGTPASDPKPCGRSPGRPTGTPRGPTPRHPALKKTT